MVRNEGLSVQFSIRLGRVKDVGSYKKFKIRFLLGAPIVLEEGSLPFTIWACLYQSRKSLFLLAATISAGLVLYELIVTREQAIPLCNPHSTSMYSAW